ncbi:NTE family protein [Dysgonomonadaceae bacterium PH5-43]|nr:NTE family protein [Dysgonomonadaceae bacterium PH5-43]
MMSLSKKKKYNLGLALSGGGARGFAHPGAIKAIENAGLKPDLIVGTSAGALAGVLYADGYTPEEIINLFSGLEFKKFAEIHLPKAGLFSTVGFRRFLKKHLHAKEFEDLAIPLKVVATNLDAGKVAVFEQGDLIEAVIASCSIPIVFEPVEIKGANYVDGGIFKNFPVSVIREDCNKIIGVNVSPLVPTKYNKTILQIAERSYHFMSKNNTLQDRKLCDVLIEIEELITYKTFDIESANKIFNIGYEYGKKALSGKE